MKLKSKYPPSQWWKYHSSLIAIPFERNCYQIVTGFIILKEWAQNHIYFRQCYEAVKSQCFKSCSNKFYIEWMIPEFIKTKLHIYIFMEFQSKNFFEQIWNCNSYKLYVWNWAIWYHFGRTNCIWHWCRWTRTIIQTGNLRWPSHCIDRWCSCHCLNSVNKEIRCYRVYLN